MKKSLTSSSSEKLSAARTYLKKEKLATLVLEAPADLFYWTGLHISMGSFVITKNRATLFVDGRYLQMCRERTDLDIAPHTKLTFTAGAVGFDASTTSYERFLFLKKKGAEAKAKLKGIDHLGQNLREVKSKYEILQIEKACALATRAMGMVRRRLRPGITEKEIAFALHLFFKKNGAEPSFNPIIAFGKNSAMPHSEPSNQRLKKNDLVLVDIGCNLDSYCSDMTRCFLLGKKNTTQVAIYTAVKKALDAALEKIRPGALSKELDDAARSCILDAGFHPYPHSIGHGVGIEVHEMPLLKSKEVVTLETNMVVTIEPGIYIENEGGVRLENQVVVTKTGYKNLTPYPFEKI